MASYESLTIPGPQTRSNAHTSHQQLYHQHRSQLHSLSRPIPTLSSRSFTSLARSSSPRRCLLLSRPLSASNFGASSLPSSPSSYSPIADRLRSARPSTPTSLGPHSDSIPRPRSGSSRTNKRSNPAHRPRPTSLPRANSVPLKHLRRTPTSTEPTRRQRPPLPPRLPTTTSTASALTAPSGIVAEGKMVVEEDHKGSRREALSRALRAVSRSGSTGRSRSWSRSEMDESEDPGPSKEQEIPSSTPSSHWSSSFPSPYASSSAHDASFPFEYDGCGGAATGGDEDETEQVGGSIGGGYITFASLNVHAPPSPPDSPSPSPIHSSLLEETHDPLRKAWWAR